MGVLIFYVTHYNSFAIWLWIYICYVSDVHRPNFLIVESLYPMIFSTINPPDESECAPIMSGSIILYYIWWVFEAVLLALTRSLIVASAHDSLIQTSYSRLSSIPLFIRMWCILHARATTDPLLPVDSWCKVCPSLMFLLFQIFSVAESASSGLFSVSCLEIIFHFTEVHILNAELLCPCFSCQFSV